MCGIAGAIVAAQAAPPDFAEQVAAMGRAIAHRGPDAEGLMERNAQRGAYRIGLAHRRLSIIDLVGGGQPLSNADGTVHIIFNGEIYNFKELRRDLESRGHRFATSSDTEVIVHAYEEYGEACVHKLRGMFAFAIWDERQEKLFLARDPFGKKPLFLLLDANRLLFASEIKAILAFPGVTREINRAALWNYLFYRYVPGPETLFIGVRKLPPGSTAVWQNGRFSTQRYYLPPDRRARRAQRPVENPVEKFRERLEEAVRIRMVSDVPFGAFLSGGLDSSVVVALMSKHSAEPVRTFSVGFAEQRYSELPYAGQIARMFGTDHHELTVSSAQLIDCLPEMVRARDAPVSEPSDIPILLLARAARKRVKMVLTGEGSDEILGGYPKHVAEHHAWAWRFLPAVLRRGLLEPLVAALPYEFRKVKIAARALAQASPQERFPGWFAGLAPHELAELAVLPSDFRSSPPLEPFDTEPGVSSLRQLLYFDQTSWLPDNLLERGDRVTMAASLEARMPFMDTELAEFVSSLPDNYRVRALQTKWILRQTIKEELPAQILERPKVGFRVPVNEWFRTSMQDYLREHLLGGQSRTREYFRRERLESVVEEHVAGRQNHEKLLWTLLTLELWHRAYA